MYLQGFFELDLTTLLYGRATGGIIKAYKMLTGKYGTIHPRFLCLRSLEQVTGGHSFKLQPNINKVNFSNRIVSMWNDLPE